MDLSWYDLYVKYVNKMKVNKKQIFFCLFQLNNRFSHAILMFTFIYEKYECSRHIYALSTQPLFLYLLVFNRIPGSTDVLASEETDCLK